MRKLGLILFSGILAGNLNAHVKVYEVYPSTGGSFTAADVGVLSSASVLIGAYDSASVSVKFVKMDPVGNLISACSVPSSLSLQFQSLKVREGKVIALDPEGVLLSDTSLSGVLAVSLGARSDADLLSGDTVVIVWGDSLRVGAGVASLSGFTLLNTLRFPTYYPGNIRYAVRTLSRGNVVVAHTSNPPNTIFLTFLSFSGGSITYDSTVSLLLPSGWYVHDPSILKLVNLPSGGLAVGLTVNTGTRPYPAFIIYDGTPSAFYMDSSGTLTDIGVSSEGILITSADMTSSPFAQVVPLSLSSGDTSLKGFIPSDGSGYVGGGAEFSPGHYAVVGRTVSSGYLRFVYTDFDLTDTTFVRRSVRTWNSFSLTRDTPVLTPFLSSPLISDAIHLCSYESFTVTPLYADDMIAPTLISHTSDTVIQAYDTLVFVFSEPMDPVTFQYGTEVIGYGSVRRPVPTSSFCTGSTCYLIVNASGNDSIEVSLTGFITDTAGVPLAPASRISLSFRLLPDRPRVIFTQPDSGEINVPLNANIGVWFSTAIDPTTVNTYTVDITDGTVNYPFTVSCPFPNMCVLDPLGDFPPATNITVSLTAGIQDTFSQPLSPKVVTFRTIEEDTLSPRVDMTVPDSGDIGVPRNFAMSVLFTKPMDTTTVAGGVSLLGSSSGSHSFSVFCPTLKNCVIRPISAFLPSEVVTVRFNSSIRDTFNRSLIPKTVVFQVGSTYDNIPPNVDIVAPPNDTLVLYHPITSPLKAAVWDNSGILMASWIVGSETYHAPLSCRSLPYVASDTTCVDVSELPSDTFVVKAIAYDLANTQNVDSIILIVHDTVRPRVSFTEPANGDMAVSPYTDVKITFTEPMDTAVFPSSAVSVVVGTSPVSFSRSWNTPYTLRLSFSDPLPWDSTVTVSVNLLQDLSGNTLVPHTFTFQIVGETNVNVRWVEMKPETVFVGNMDSVKVVAVATSDHPITHAVLLIGDRDSAEMRAVDGVYDEPVETVSVWLRTDALEAGKYSVRVKAYNRYVFGVSQPKDLYVLDVPLLSPENVYVYPSPVKDYGKIRIVVGEPTTVTVEVFDLKYRRVLHESRTFNGATVYERTLPTLPVGVYLLRVRAGDITVNKWFAVVGRR